MRHGSGTVYTVGHSSLPLEDLCATLKAEGVSIVVDVRRFPSSRRNPQYARKVLQGALELAGIRCLWLGDALGGVRRGGYEHHMTTEEFRRGIVALESVARRAPTAILCAERDPSACHRRFIADELVRRGWRVVHLTSPGSATHVLQEDLFAS